MFEAPRSGRSVVSRSALIGEIGEAYSANESILGDKAKYTRHALIATAVEVVLVVAALVAYRLI